MADHTPGQEDRRRIYRVGELTRHIKTTLENDIGTVWVEGEISNFIHHSSGHMYFALKDADGLIQAALFRGSQRRMTLKPANGMQVRAHGQVSAYPQRSQFQLIVDSLEEAGLGSLHEQFEKLKAKLQAEGLFDASRKKPLPMLPQRIGIVTSPTGAAIRDMLNILGRRFPNLHIQIVPVRVQGEGAAQEIAAAIDFLNGLGRHDVLIVGRGGGSLEDLWAFNEEVVARAIARSTIPVISAVGHEVDFTISDFVADLRAPTPSAAAELVIESKDAFLNSIGILQHRLAQSLQNFALALRNRLTRSAHSYVFREPGQLVLRHRERLEGLKKSLAGELRKSLTNRQQVVDQCEMRMTHRAVSAAKDARQNVNRLASQLRALGPQGVLERGYSITRRKDGGGLVRTADAVKPGDEIETLTARGQLTSTITTIEKGTSHGQTG